MPTRLALANAAAPVSPDFDAAWSATADATRAYLRLKLGSSNVFAGPVDVASGGDALAVQAVSPRLVGGQEISGLVKSYAVVREGSSTDDINALLTSLRLVSEDGTVVRDTLLAHGNRGTTVEPAASAITASSREVIDPTSSVKAVVTQQGDRLVLEVGFAAAATGTTPVGHWLIGESQPDTSEVEGTLGSASPWIEFEDSLEFIAPTASGFATDESGFLITATLSEPCTPTSGTGAFTIEGSGGEVVSWAIEGDVLTVRLNHAIGASEAVTLTYDGTGGITNGGGVPMAAFADQAVDNNRVHPIWLRNRGFRQRGWWRPSGR